MPFLQIFTSLIKNLLMCSEIKEKFFLKLWCSLDKIKKMRPHWSYKIKQCNADSTVAVTDA